MAAVQPNHLHIPDTMSAFFSNILGAGRDLQATEGKVELPLNDDEAASQGIAMSEKSEFRIEGMTCGACVEVRGAPHQ